MGVLTGVLFLTISGAMMLYAVYLAARRESGGPDTEAAQREALAIVEDAKAKSELIVKEAELKAKDLMVEVRAQAEREVRDQHRELTALESKLAAREESIDKRLESFERRDADFNRRDQNLRTREKSLADREAERQELIEAARAKLEAVAGLTREEARHQVVEEVAAQARHDAARQIRVIEEEAREEADRRAKRIVSIAIERLAGEFVTERTVSV